MTEEQPRRAGATPVARWARRVVLDRAYRTSSGLPGAVARARFDGVAADVDDRVAAADRLGAPGLHLAAVLLRDAALRAPADAAWRRDARRRAHPGRPVLRPLPDTAVGRFDQTSGHLQRADEPLGDGGRLRTIIWVGLINSVFLFAGR